MATSKSLTTCALSGRALRQAPRLLIDVEGLRSQTGCHRRPGKRFGRLSMIAPNHVQLQFDVSEPNRVWVTDPSTSLGTGITCIRTHEGWLYLSVVLDLFSRKVIGWSMPSRIDRELALNAVTDGGVAQTARAKGDRPFRSRQP